jgi:hypothetical protein
LAELDGRRPEHILLFTHLPLFVRHPFERLDPADYRNRYLVIAPPGRDRLLGLVREHRVTAVFTGHIHAPWETSHAWPEGFATHFISTGSSGVPSPMAIEHFDLPSSPAQGLGYHEHHLSEDGLSSRYHEHAPASLEGRWKLGQAWRAYCSKGHMPSTQAGLNWYDIEYRPSSQEWQESAPASPFSFSGREAKTCFVRQTWEADVDVANLYLELVTEQAVEVYLNGELLYALEALTHRPAAWQSAGGTYTIDSPILSLGLNQRLVRQGENVLALLVRKSEIDGQPFGFAKGQGPGGEEYIAYRKMVPTE